MKAREKKVANEEHLKILKQGVDMWNLWRQGNPTVLPNLSKTDLSYADLYEADLYDADLSGANLSHADLSYAFLVGASLYEANFTAAIVEKASFQHCIGLTEQEKDDLKRRGAVFEDRHCNCRA